MLQRLVILFLFLVLSLGAKPALLDSKSTKEKMSEILAAHASQKSLTSPIIERLLVNYIEEFDPTKSYFIASDIDKWLHPKPALVEKIQKEIDEGDFSTFNEIYAAMLAAVERRDRLEKLVDEQALPEKVDANKFKDLEWTTSEQDLLTRIIEIKALQVEASKKLHEELADKSLQRIDKQRKKYEEELMNPNATYREQLMLSKFMKAFAGSLDTHTSYFTPEEAQQFLINVQQRLFGIGAALRDDINGFRVIKLVEGGPAEIGGELKQEDLIIAVDGEPVVGMSIVDAVALIRGGQNTPVTLTVVREKEGQSQTLDVTVVRNEVVLKESRFEASYEPFGDGVVAYLKLFSFYQDPEHSSAADLRDEFEKIKKDHKILGVILDLRNNSGGMLSQAVSVTGLFISKGVVVSIKDDTGKVQHLRDIDGQTMWNGPLVVMINRASASASEIVAQTLQDYGRAIVVGDDHSYGKGSFQTFTLNASGEADVNPEGEFKVTRGRYYTVSGKTPQLEGVISDIVVPGSLSESEVGEKYAKYPLESDAINPSFDDDLSDIPYFQRSKISALYKFNLQPKLTVYEPYIPVLRKNAEKRIEANKNYQAFLEEVKKKDLNFEEEAKAEYGKNDLQLSEGYNIMKDLIHLQDLDQFKWAKSKEDAARQPALSVP